jgi:chromosome segregation ATPase
MFGFNKKFYLTEDQWDELNFKFCKQKEKIIELEAECSSKEIEISLLKDEIKELKKDKILLQKEIEFHKKQNQIIENENKTLKKLVYDLYKELNQFEKANLKRFDIKC